jgi:hypothetical protein
MSGKQRYRNVKGSQTARKEDRPLIFSGALGVTTNAENQVEVPGRPGFVWVRLRNQLNELIQAFNEDVSPVFDLPVRVEYDKLQMPLVTLCQILLHTYLHMVHLILSIHLQV